MKLYVIKIVMQVLINILRRGMFEMNIKRWIDEGTHENGRRRTKTNRVIEDFR